MAQCEGLHWLSRMGGGPRSTLQELTKSRVPGVQEHPRNPHSQSFFCVFLIVTIASSPIAVRTVTLKGNRNSIWAPLAIKHNTQTSNTLFMLFTIHLLNTKTHLNTAMVIWFAIYNLLNFNLNVFLFWVGPVDRWIVNEQAKNIIMKKLQSSFSDGNRCIWQRNTTSSVAVLCHQLWVIQVCCYRMKEIMLKKVLI